MMKLMNIINAEKILNVLKKEGSIRSYDLEQITGFSSFLLKKEIADLNDYLKEHGYDIRIASKRGYKNGYSMEGDSETLDVSSVISELSGLVNPMIQMNSHQDSRVLYIASRLLQKIHDIKLDELSGELSFSIRSLNKDMILVRELLMKYGITVKNRPYHGLSISCTEFDRQSCMYAIYKQAEQKFSLDQQDVLFYGKIYVRERKNLYHTCVQVLHECGIVLSDLSIIDLSNNVWISSIFHETDLDKEIRNDGNVIRPDQQYYKAAKDILDQVFSVHGIVPDDFDCRSLAVRIAGMNMQETAVHPESSTFKMTAELLDILDRNNGMKMQKDPVLFTALSNHLQQFQNNRKYYIVYVYPMREEILNHYYSAYCLAYQTACILRDSYSLVLNEDEIINLTIDFQYYLSRLKQKKRVLLISASGSRNTKILAADISREYGGYIDALDYIPMHEKKKAIPDSYDLILTTHWIGLETVRPVVEIEYFLDDKTRSRLNAVFVSDDLFQNRPEEYISEEWFFSGKSGEKYAEEVLEGLSGRDSDVLKFKPLIIGSVMICMNQSDDERDPGISVCVTEKTIRWNDKKIRMILQERGNVNFFSKRDLIVRIEQLNSENRLAGFCAAPSCQTFKILITDI